MAISSRQRNVGLSKVVRRICMSILFVFLFFWRSRGLPESHLSFQQQRAMVTRSRSTTTSSANGHVLRDNQTVVMTAATGYPLEVYKRFIRSLRRVYDGDIVVLVKESTLNETSIVAFCNEHGVRLQLLPAIIATKTMNKNRHRMEGTTFMSEFLVKAARYVGYSEICKKERYTLCFASDFRDVLFQSNPFTAAPAFDCLNYDLILAQESLRKTFKNCKMNRMWIQTCWGDRFLRKIEQETPICSGTIFGSPLGFQILQKKLTAEMSRTSTIENCITRDQGLLNYLLFSNGLRGARISVQPRGKGLVHTMGAQPYTVQRNSTTSEVVILNDDGSPAPVLHQFDRNEALAQELWRTLV